VVKPALRRREVAYAIEQYGISARRACRLFGVSRATWAYRSRRPADSELRERLIALAAQLPRYGYKRLCRRLRRGGVVVNHKKIYRLYREEGLKVRKRSRKKIERRTEKAALPTGPNQRWSMDFTFDRLADGRRFRTLNVVDDFTREAVLMQVERSFAGWLVARALDRLIAERGAPKEIVCDNGPEFTSKAMELWSERTGIPLRFIEPGKPVQNCYVESFNGRFRDECLNDHWFTSMEEARREIAAWQHDYNETREHGSLGGMTPSEYRRAMESAENAPRLPPFPQHPLQSRKTRT
jgi:putative transposase